MNLLWDRFEKGVAKHAQREAVVCEDRRLKYSGLRAAIEAAAARLQLEQLPAGSVVGIYLPNGIEFVVAFWAIVRAGHVALTLNTKYQEDELRQYLAHRPVAQLISEPGDFETLTTLFAGEGLTTKISTLEASGQETVAEIPPVASAAESAPVLMQFSTGSTGVPKGVVRTHGNLLREIEGARERVRPQPSDRILGIVPLYHAHGFGNAMCAALFSGAALVLSRNFDPRACLDLLAKERITVFPAVPFMVKLLAVMRSSGELDFSSLRICYTAGAALPPADATRFEARFGIPVHQLYGSTETGAVALSYTANGENPPQGTVGTPFSHVAITLFDDEGVAVAPGEEGEIGIATNAAAESYDANPTATQASFRNGHFFPGDIGRIDASGRLAITGRKSLFINAGGNKVDPVEVEQVVLELPEVQEAVALGIPSSNGGETIKAVIVAEGDLTREAVLSHCRERLASFKHPKVVEFRAEIPKSPLGKVLRKYLV